MFMRLLSARFIVAEHSSSSSSGGIGVCGLLGVAFVVLKLCGVIDWSWWWVTAPFWGPLVLLLAILIVGGGGYLTYQAIKSATAK